MNITLHTVIVAQAIKITGLEEEVAELTHDTTNLKASVDFLTGKLKQNNETINTLRKKEEA